MSKRVKKVPLWLFGLVVAGALAFGAQRAMATPVFLLCNGGTCTTQGECEDNCDAIFGMGNYDHAQCLVSINCCRCFL